MPKDNGFTLIELLIVISIMSLLSVVAFVNFRNFSADVAVRKSASELQSFLQTAQNNAISRISCNGTSGATWLVKFNDKKNIDLKCFTDPATVSLQKTLSFNDNTIEVETIAGKTTSCTSEKITINFAPLYGTITFKDDGPLNLSCISESDQVTVTLQDSKTGSQKVVTVKKGGTIDVQ